MILELFTRQYGRLALLAKGVKRPSSSFRPILLPLQPLRVSFGGDADIKTLKAAEWQGGHVMPTGDALMAGYYLNELVLRLLAREDPHPVLFDAYAQAVAAMASSSAELLEAALRAFELVLLREIGLLPALDVQTLTLQALQPAQRYTLVPEGGLRVAEASDPYGLSGAQWQLLQALLSDTRQFLPLLRACAVVSATLKPLLRALLSHHCGIEVLRTRQLMIDLQSL